jgi:hypothetical protein
MNEYGSLPVTSDREPHALHVDAVVKQMPKGIRLSPFTVMYDNAG